MHRRNCRTHVLAVLKAPVAVGAALVLSLLGGCGERRTVTAASSVAVLTDLQDFCQPARGISDMFSTYDRQGGNADWWQVPPPVAGTRDLYEALRVKGPGCIKRIWQTNTPATEWLFYFDDETEPRLRLSGGDMFGGDAGSPRRPVQGGASGGCYSYLPLPFARSIRIVLRMPEIRQDARPYFHINYERYPAGTSVETWKPTSLEGLTNLLAQAASGWRRTAADDAAVLAGLAWRRISLPAGGRAILLDQEGEGLVRALAVRPAWDASANAVLRSVLLRGLVLEATWDGAASPSVQVPLGDFFCNGLHPRSFASLPMACIDGRYLCRLPMPFRRHARLVVRNDTSVSLALDAATEVQPRPPDCRLYLHAAFHDALSAGDRNAPFELLRATGSGKYVGCYLTALGMDGGWNILEGDEYFLRDGSSEPIEHGTGLEDYFNAGWYYFGLFELPLHGLLEKAVMRTSQYRFHLTDPVTFRKSLRMEWEFGDANRAAGYLSSAAYWYQDAAGPAGSAIPPLEKRFPPFERVGLATIMDELFELERMGLVAEARERCAFYERALASMPEHAIFRLRALAYRELQEGYSAVRAEYAALAAATNVPPDVSQQAQLLLWRGEAPGRAIFGAHGQSDYRLLVDGRPIGGGGDPIVWRGYAVALTPGEHLLQVELTPRAQQTFFSAAFSAFFTNVVSDASWDYSLRKPDGWPEREGDRSLWHPYESDPGMLPTMAWWTFAINAFPCVQSAHQQGMPCAGLDKRAGQTVWLRRRIVVPATQPDRPPMPPRRTCDPGGAPVRPADDTSNEGVTHRKG